MVLALARPFHKGKGESSGKAKSFELLGLKAAKSEIYMVDDVRPDGRARCSGRFCTHQDW